VHKTLYYLVHKDNGLRCHYYNTRAGARIAQRARNRLLGFDHRVERVEVADNWEVERCVSHTGEIRDATWAIVEDTVEIVDQLWEKCE
jgi:hypothetical protein